MEEGEEDCSAPASGGAIPSQGSQERSLPFETTIHWDLLFFFFKQSFSPLTPPKGRREGLLKEGSWGKMSTWGGGGGGVGVLETTLWFKIWLLMQRAG